MPTYSSDADLMLGEIPLPRYIDKEKVIQEATDEIDSHIGFAYKTPVDMTENGPVARPARLLLKRIAAHLSSGRIIMAIDSSGQDDELQAYGIYLIREAQKELKSIVNGGIELTGAERAPRSESGRVTAPLINNIDPYSQVEAFYSAIQGRQAPYRPHGTW